VRAHVFVVLIGESNRCDRAAELHPLLALGCSGAVT